MSNSRCEGSRRLGPKSTHNFPSVKGEILARVRSWSRDSRRTTLPHEIPHTQIVLELQGAPADGFELRGRSVSEELGGICRGRGWRLVGGYGF